MHDLGNLAIISRTQYKIDDSTNELQVHLFEKTYAGKKQKRKIKMLKSTYLAVELMIYGSKVALMSTKEDMAGVIIEDAAIADTLRNFHKAMWHFLPDYK